MQKIFVLCCFVAVSTVAQTQVVQVDHLRIAGNAAHEMADFFANTIGLPASWGKNSSKDELMAVVWMGNMAVYLSGRNRDAENNKATTIALKAIQHEDTLVRLLDEYGINYAAPVPVTTFQQLDAKAVCSDFPLKDLGEENFSVVIAEYRFPDFILEKRKQAKKLLEQVDGGKLGIRSVKEIIIGSRDPQKSIHSWISVPGIRRKEGNRFSFFTGPDIVIEAADRDEIKEIVIKVTSLQTAKDFLLAKKLLVPDGNKTLISPEKTAGFRVLLEE